MKDSYVSALSRIAWGYLLVYLNFNLNFGMDAVSPSVNILPTWAGYLLLFLSLDSVGEREPAARLLKPLAVFLIVEDGVMWTAALLGFSQEIQWLGAITCIISLYFHFQLLTNLADIAYRQGSEYWKRLKYFRNFQTVLITGMYLSALTDSLFQRQWISIFVLILCGGGLMICIVCILTTLFAYRNEQRKGFLIPDYVRRVLETLQQAGCEAWVVGGCVRDVLMGREPQDWDVCTSALPEETEEIFQSAGADAVPTGRKHGTVTVIMEGKAVEVTTYRIDGAYKDGRHPEKVKFTRSLAEDLARRDFTMNAMAYSPSSGLVDLYDGKKDIGDRMIRCVGEPEKRFAEDALRILRALRFKAVLGFTIEEETARAIRSCRHFLEKISKERVSAELSKLLLGIDADRVLKGYGEVLAVCAPEIRPACVSQLPENLPVRLAAVFPEDTEQALRNLKYDSHTVATVSALARLMKTAPPEKPAEIRRLLYREGREVTGLYYDAKGYGDVLASVLRENPCCSLQQLALKGGDLIRMGMEPGPQVGRALGEMLEKVIDGELENSSEVLLDYARERGYIR